MAGERVLHATPACDGFAGETAIVDCDWRPADPVGSAVAVTLRVTDPSGVQARVPLGRTAARLLACALVEEAQ